MTLRATVRQIREEIARDARVSRTADTSIGARVGNRPNDSTGALVDVHLVHWVGHLLCLDAV